MGVFDDRKDGYEQKFAHDEESRFKVSARTNKLLALWAAQQMGMEETKALEYAMEIVEASFTLTKDWDVVSKIHADLRQRKVNVSVEALRDEKERLQREAAKQILGS
jgi:hypothetical protein